MTNDKVRDVAFDLVNLHAAGIFLGDVEKCINRLRDALIKQPTAEKSSVVAGSKNTLRRIREILLLDRNNLFVCHAIPSTNSIPVDDPVCADLMEYDELIAAIDAALQQPVHSTAIASDCTRIMREQGKSYPRTCPKCGLGPCAYQPTIAIESALKAKNAQARQDQSAEIERLRDQVERLAIDLALREGR